MVAQNAFQRLRWRLPLSSGRMLDLYPVTFTFEILVLFLL